MCVSLLFLTVSAQFQSDLFHRFYMSGWVDGRAPLREDSPKKLA